MLGHLVLAEHGADRDADLGCAAQGLALTRHAGCDFGQVALGGGEEVLALSGALAREIGVAADDQPLAGKVGRGYRRHVALVEQRHLQMAAADGLLERRRAQGGDPVEAGGAQILVDARLRDHAAIADQDDVIDGEAAFELGDLVGERHGIGDVALEHFDGDGAAVGRAQEAVDDLQLALLAVAVVAAFGQGAAAAFDIARRNVVEHQRPALEMALRQRGLDRALTLEEPVERGVEFVLADLAQGQLDAEARGGGGGMSALAVASLEAGAMMRLTIMARTRSRGRLGSSQPWARAAGRDRPRAPAEHGGDGPMRQRALDGEGLLARRQHDAALEHAAQTLDVLGRPVGEVEQRALPDGSAVPIALAQQDGGRRAAVGDGLDVHGLKDSGEAAHNQ